MDTPTGDRLCKPLLIDRLAKIVREPIPLHTTGAPELVECAASRRIAGGELLHHHFRRYLQPRADQADGGVREVVVPGVRVLRVCKLHLFAGVQVNDGPRPSSMLLWSALSISSSAGIISPNGLPSDGFCDFTNTVNMALITAAVISASV